MITVDLSVHTPATIRWALSPVLETLGWLRLARDGASDPTYGAPARATKQLLSRPDVALVCELLPSGGGPTPDFLAPAPPAATSTRAAESQLAEIDNTDHAQAAVEVWAASGDRPLSKNITAALRDGTLPARAARGLATFWEEGMAEVFGLAETALRAEISRCEQLADSGGIGAVLNAIQEQLSWGDEPANACEHRTDTESGMPELLVIPTALYGPRLTMRLQGTRPYVAYPIDATPAPTDPITGLRRLIGPTRAAILRHLSSARTTTELSEELRLAAATVSYHVKVMQRAGLLERSRQRHNVFYELSPTGRQLLAGIS
ncbi:MAG TPA: winged helix-turn-helix domain-containing protein [Flexivirga sp.]|uniref:winged helix-turn-helix domain-containing protein n=1 Tax=Flexivirga sp. TaxID=1962927 RepID=UPI002B626894|nr:winged helix-turn-helix domain-containing protein [Flexivirga sp.]HWC24244.1 winged helix-turn-helix domain-containing protein [Flexivirga sp.]